MNSEMRLTFAVPCVIGAQESTFYKPTQKVRVAAPGTLVKRLVAVCDGTKTVGEITNLLRDEWEEEPLRDFLFGLHTRGVLLESRLLGEAMWNLVENPSYFMPKVSDIEAEEMVRLARARHKDTVQGRMFDVAPFALGNIAKERCSTRVFCGRTVSLEAIVQLVWATYGETSRNGYRTVPSAGALYPLEIFLAVLKASDHLPEGLYRVRMPESNKVGFEEISTDTGAFLRSFLDPLSLEGVSGVIVVAGSFTAVSAKYGNRSVLYTALEAGHAAQNTLLAATELGIDTLEIGGFTEGLLSESLKLAGTFRPLTTIAFGYGGQPHTPRVPGIQVDWAIPRAGTYKLPFCVAYARMGNKIGEDEWSCGKSVSPSLAYIKAVSEAQEWAACEYVPNTLTVASLRELEGSVDPRTIAAFHPAQYRLKSFPFTPLDEKLQYAWAEGEDEFSGAKTFVLGDHVFISYTPDTPRYVHASSSGVAAHPSRLQAIKNGTLELIERDAFMIAYLTGVQRNSVREVTIPGKIRRRIKALRAEGFQVTLKDYSLDLAPVVFIFAQNPTLSYTMCAACADFDLEEALDHALMEIESAVLIRLTNGPLKPIKPFSVRTPEDHGALYEQKRYFQKANFLAREGPEIAFCDVGKGTAVSWESLMHRLEEDGRRLITVSHHLPGGAEKANGLSIIRSIIPGLVPISFGYQTEPKGMKRISEMAERISGQKVLYAGMPKFPHPYT